MLPVRGYGYYDEVNDVDMMDEEKPISEFEKPINDTMAQITAVQARYTEWLMERKNVVGVGVGLQKRRGAFTQHPCLVVLVSRKQPVSELPTEDRIPRELDGVLVDIQVAGTFTAQEG